MPGADVLRHISDGETITKREQRDVVLLAERDDMTITWSRYAPEERGPDPHVHREHTDAFYVLDGELTFAVGPQGERVRMAAGGFVAVPPNVVHSFANEGDVDARYLNFHAPDGGFAAYMRAARDGRNATFDSFDPPADGGLAATEAVLSGPGEGEQLVTATRTVLLKCDLPDLSLGEWRIDGPFEGPGLHHHDDQVDSFYVLDGELEVAIEDAVHAAGAGVLACVPRGMRHTFAHRRETRGHFLNIHAPDCGFADYLRLKSR
jgi:mannose-6-phosphate isomerase-like protein (cupin superfamily)